jgi:hypothetical protein
MVPVRLLEPVAISSPMHAWMRPAKETSAMLTETDPGDVILEFVHLGALIRVSAMEPKSLTEVVIYGPASAGEAALRRTVLCKLDYALADRATGRQSMPQSALTG